MIEWWVHTGPPPNLQVMRWYPSESNSFPQSHYVCLYSEDSTVILNLTKVTNRNYLGFSASLWELGMTSSCARAPCVCLSMCHLPACLPNPILIFLGMSAWSFTDSPFVSRVTYDNITQSCSFLQSLAITRLRGSDLPTHVAVFGNPDPANSADWVPLLKDPQPAMEVVNPGSGVCPAVPVNVHLEVLYALTGDFTNPQSKVYDSLFICRIDYLCQLDSLSLLVHLWINDDCSEKSPTSLHTHIRTYAIYLCIYF
jgi:hypothetical protein